jgi:hypothetical protein
MKTKIIELAIDNIGDEEHIHNDSFLYHLRKIYPRAKITYAGEYTEVPPGTVTIKDQSKSTWIVLTADDEEPAQYARNAGEPGIETITNEDLRKLAVDHVCVEIYFEYPRATKYGAPRAALTKEHAAALADSFGFRVLPADTLVVNIHDTGHDNIETTWLKLAKLNP